MPGKLIQTLHVFDAPFQRLGCHPPGIFMPASCGRCSCAGLYLSRRLSSAIYNEVVQFFLIVAGFLPLVGSAKERGRLVRTQSPAWSGSIHTHGLVWEARTPTGWAWNWFGLAMGLGFGPLLGRTGAQIFGGAARHGGGIP